MKSHRELLSISFSIIFALFILPCLSPAASAFAAPPPNDNFANAQVITGPMSSVTGTNVGATKQPGEPNHAFDPGGKSVWYKWTAPAAAFGITFDTLNSVLSDTLLAVYTGTSVNNLTRVASNDDYGNLNGFNRRSRVFFPAIPGTVYYIAVDGFSGLSGAITLRCDVNRRISRGSDFDHSEIDDITVFRPSSGAWYSRLSSGNVLLALNFGAAGDVPVPADYDGDGRTDFAVFRPANSTWYVFKSSTSSMRSEQFGVNGDIPTPGDFTANGYADFAVFRPSNGTWYIRDFTSGVLLPKQFGQTGDVPAQADYDGDGRTDVAVFRPSNGYWYILNSFDNSLRFQQWGVAGDIPVPGDYGASLFEGKADIAVFRPSDGNWYVLSSRDNSMLAVTWGQAGDIPQPMDTVTDTNNRGITDFVVFRPSNSTWYILDGFDNSTKSVQWGAAGDRPASSSFVVQQ